MKKILLLIVAILIIAPVSVEAKKKKKEKKQMTLTEMIESIEWDRPEKTGKPIDELYDEGDKFYATIATLTDSVPIYEIKRVINAEGDTVLAPVDKEGHIRSGLDATNQSLAGVNYLLTVVNNSLTLSTQLMSHATDILTDAASAKFGNKEAKARVKANGQMKNFVKIFPIMLKAVKEQSRLMKLYREEATKLTADDKGVTTLPGYDTDSFEIFENASEEELAAALAADIAAADTELPDIELDAVEDSTDDTASES